MATKQDFTLVLGWDKRASSLFFTELNQFLDLAGKVVDFIQEQAEQMRAYDRVIHGHTVSVREADQATRGMVDTVQLHRDAARLEAAGLQLSERQYRALSVAAASYGQRIGVDVTQAHERLTTAVISTEVEGLRPFAIRLRQGMTIEEKQQEIIRRLTESYGDQEVEVENLADAIDQLKNNWGTAWSEMTLALSREIPGIVRMLSSISSALGDVADRLAAIRRTNELARYGSLSAEMTELERWLTAHNVDLGTGELSAATGLPQAAAAGLYSGPGGVAATLTRTREEARRRWRRYRELSQMDPELLRLTDEEAARGVREAQAAARGPATPTPTGGGPTRPWGMSEAEQTRAQVLAQQEEVLREIARRRAEWESDQAEERRQRIIDDTRSEIDLLRKREEARERYEEQMARRREEISRRTTERIRAEMEAQSKAQEEFHSRISNISGAMQGMASMAHQVGEAVSAMAGKHSAASKAMAAIEGAFLVAYNVVKAATEIADAVGAFARQSYGEGALHVIAAALHTSAAVTAAAKLGASLAGAGSTPSVPGSAQRGSGRPEDYGRRGRPEVKRTTVFNFNGAVTSRRAREDIRRLEAEEARRND